MNPVQPSLHVDGARFVVFGASQEDYIPLTASVDIDGTVVTEWELTTEESQRLLCGGRIRLMVATMDSDIGAPGHGLQPVRIDVMVPTRAGKES